MAGNALQSPVNPAAKAVRFTLAADADDVDIRRLLREHAMPGDIQLTLEREPNYALANEIAGDAHRLLLARDASSGRLLAIGSVSVRDAFINGRIERLGYLGQLRFTPPVRRSVLLGGYRFLHDLLPSLNARIFFTSIAADNSRAQRLLEANLPGMPIYHRLEEFVTLALSTRSRSRTRHAIQIERATSNSIDQILNCLRRNARRYQFTPAWSARELISLRNLPLHNFYLATHQGQVVGCMARWDQTPFKQVVIRGYSRRLAFFRPLFNCLAPLVGRPALPAVGTVLDQDFISHLAIDADDPIISFALVEAIRADARAAGRDYLMIGLARRHPLLSPIATEFAHRAYRSILYIVHWPDAGPEPLIDDRVPHPEVALL